MPDAMSRLRQVFGIDLRTLATVRIALAALVVLDLCLRARDLSAHYTDRGVLPRAALIEQFLTRFEWSLHLLNGTAGVQAFLFVLAGLAGLAMLLGFHTRVATVLTWLFLCSVQTRNPAISPAVDDALRLFVFWSMFLPMGAAWSFDQLLRPKAHADPHVSIASAAFMVQLSLIYVMTVVHKSDPAWRSEFTAIYYAMSLDEMATSLGLALRNFPGLMKALTVITIALESVAPILVFTPVWTAPVRMVLIVSMMALHLGMGLCLTIGIFPFVMWAAWWIFIPGQFWDRLGVRTGVPEGLLEPQTPLRRAGRMAGQALAAAALAYVLFYNLRIAEPQRYWGVVSRPAQTFGTILKLKQNWGVFAPRPHSGDGWYVMPAELVDGSTVDLFRGGRVVSFDKPERITDDYPNDRWRRYMLHLRVGVTKRHLPHYLDYLCRQWNEAHLGTPRLARSVELYFMEEYTLPDGTTAPIQKKLLAEHQCLGNEG